MLKYIIGAILIIIVLLIIGLIVRKQMEKSIDEYEDWKVDLINRNIAAELSRVKGLNLEGETKERFEHWKLQYETILTGELATVEELLYDAEKAKEQFRLAKTKSYLAEIDVVLTEVESQFDDIITELNELIHTDEKNRSQVEKLTPEINELRTKLTQDRFKYEHAEARFEETLIEIENELLRYEEIVVAGNYGEAKQLLTNLTERFYMLKEEFDEFPDLYRLCKQGLPAKLDDLYKGLMEMRKSGYPVDELKFDKEIQDYHARLIDCVILLETENNNEVKELANDIALRIEEMFDVLEAEAIAKNYINSKLPTYKLALENTQVHFLNTKTEVDSLKRTYHLEDEDLAKYMAFEQKINQLKIDLTTLTEGYASGEKPNIELREVLEDGFNELEQIEAEHKLFRKTIQNLRKEEIEARDDLDEVIKEISQTNRKIRSSNIPEVPDYIWTFMEVADEKNERVFDVLSKHPLDIIEVQQAITAAKQAVTHATEQTNLMLEQAKLTERVIQYANRYRSSYPVLAGKLVESERLFRAGEYELALELAATAVEEIEPGAYQKIEKI